MDVNICKFLKVNNCYLPKTTNKIKNKRNLQLLNIKNKAADIYGFI